MQQFVVPQFIDVEDKVLGPISVRQFVTMLVGAGMIFLLYKLMSFFAFIFAAIFVLLLVFAFAFIKINGRHFHYFLLTLLQTYKRPQLKLWRKDLSRYDIPRGPAKRSKKWKYEPQEKTPLTTSRLAQISLVVDTGGVYERSEKEQDESVKTTKKITELEI